LQGLHRFGSFLNCLSRKNSCSPAVKTKSVWQSMHFNILSCSSIEECSLFSSLARSAAFELRTFIGRTDARGLFPLNFFEIPGLGPPRLAAWIHQWAKEIAPRLRQPVPALSETQSCEPGRRNSGFLCRYSCSLRAFFRLRLRANASFTRFFSPGLR